MLIDTIAKRLLDRGELTGTEVEADIFWECGGGHWESAVVRPLNVPANRPPTSGSVPSTQPRSFFIHVAARPGAVELLSSSESTQERQAREALAIATPIDIASSRTSRLASPRSWPAKAQRWPVPRSAGAEAQPRNTSNGSNGRYAVLFFDNNGPGGFNSVANSRQHPPPWSSRSPPSIAQLEFIRHDAPYADDCRRPLSMRGMSLAA